MINDERESSGRTLIELLYAHSIGMFDFGNDSALFEFSHSNRSLCRHFNSQANGRSDGGLIVRSRFVEIGCIRTVQFLSVRDWNKFGILI